MERHNSAISRGEKTLLKRRSPLFERRSPDMSVENALSYGREGEVVDR